MKYRIGDTIAIHVSKPLCTDSPDKMFSDFLIAESKGEMPEWAKEDIEYITITTQDQLDFYNSEES